MHGTLQRLTFHFRLLLLAISSVGLLVFGLFALKPRTINSFDRSLVERHEQRYQSRFREALVQLKKDGGEAGVKSLETILAELEEVQKLDRHADVKRKALRAVTTHYSKQKQIARALSWYDAWVAYDERDLMAQMGRVRLLAQIPARQSEADDVLGTLLRKAPESWLISGFHIENLMTRGKEVEAMIAYRKWASATFHATSQSWDMYFDTGSGFSERQKTALRPAHEGGQRMELRARLPANTIKLRVDLPPWIPLALKDPLITIGDGEEETEIDLRKVRLRRHQIKMVGDVLVADGRADPYFYLQIPAEALAGRPRTAAVHAEVRLASIADLFPRSTNAAEIAEEAAKRLIEDGRLIDAVLLYFDWSSAQVHFFGKAWQIFWDDGRGFNEKQKQTFRPVLQADHSLELQMELPAAARRLRIDPPANVSLNLGEPSILIDQGSSSAQFDLLHEQLSLKGIKKEAGHLVSPAIKDPYFSWVIPGSFSKRREAGTLVFRTSLQPAEFTPAILQHLRSPASVRAVIDDLETMGRARAARALEDSWKSRYGGESFLEAADAVEGIL